MVNPAFPAGIDLNALLQTQQNQIDINNLQKTELLKQKNELALLKESYADYSQRINQLEKNQKGIPQKGMEFAFKLGTKTGGKELAFQVGKHFAGKEVAKQWSKTTVKKLIPGVSILAGLICGANRLYNGEYWRAAGEVVSGGLACIPGLGTLGSVAIDGVLFVGDIAPIYSTPVTPKKPTPIALEEAYQALSLSTNPLPSKNDIETAHKYLVKILHSDHATAKAAGQTHNYDELFAFINTCKDTIFTNRGF